jgi:hypothetical protein
VSPFGRIGEDPGCDPIDIGGIAFPRGSGVSYGFFHLLVGGIRDGDTLVSTALDQVTGGLWNGSELFPICHDGTAITSRSRRREVVESSSGCVSIAFDSTAVSDHDLTVTLSDTVARIRELYVDPIDGRAHLPLGIEIHQRSYAWAMGHTEDFVLFDLEICNTGYVDSKTQEHIQGDLKGVFLGIQSWVWALNESNPVRTYDEITGIVRVAPSVSHPQVQLRRDLMWWADNDADGSDWRAVTGAIGIMPVGVPHGVGAHSFNWWTPPWEYLDWGPATKGSRVNFPLEGSGIPYGDKAKYQMMANGEFDYASVETALNHEASGWNPPPPEPEQGENIANGFAFDGLLSIGPFDLSPDSCVNIGFALLGGDNFNPGYETSVLLLDPQHPEAYESHLDFTDLLRNAEWASWVYDTPGLDTDGDGWAGEYYLNGNDTVYFKGDGVKDLIAALPPSAPRVQAQTRAGRIVLHWNGRATETEEDLFSQRIDFEGYRIYMSRTGREDEWAFLTQRDLFNYARFTWNRGKDRWEMIDPPFTLDSLKTLYDALCDTSYGYPFHPDSFSVPLVEEALLEVHFDPNQPDRLDSIYRYFAPYEANNLPDDASLAMAADAGVDVTGVIRKLYPQSSPTDTAYREDGTPYLPYYEYEYVVKDLQVAEPVFLSVTAFDHGDPASKLEPLESSKSVTAQEVWPVNSSEVVESERPKPGVYPNPYRQIDAYYDNNWENRRGLEPDRERARQVTFYNVPDTCVLSIYTLDGDLVKRLHHSYPPESSEATVVRWDLITRNTQAVKTGIYIWSVESRFGTDVGKLVIIK